jgi:hypothetical protein
MNAYSVVQRQALAMLAWIVVLASIAPIAWVRFADEVAVPANVQAARQFNLLAGPAPGDGTGG